MRSPIFKHLTILKFFLIASGFVNSAPCFATISSDFSDGYGTASSGWTSPWQYSTDNNTNGSAIHGISSSNPLLSGDGNYFFVDTTAGPSNIQFSSYLSRSYASSGDLNLGELHTTSFLLRLDQYSGALSNGVPSELMISGTSNGLTPLWNITLGYGNWLFINGTGTGSGAWAYSGITPVIGDIYRFQITENPSSSSYIGTVEDLTRHLIFSSGNLGYQVTSYIGASGITFQTDPFNGHVGFSLDSVVVSAVPLPGTAYLFFTALLFCNAVFSPIARFHSNSWPRLGALVLGR
jgi:hypothetical protein